MLSVLLQVSRRMCLDIIRRLKVSKLNDKGLLRRTFSVIAVSHIAMLALCSYFPLLLLFFFFLFFSFL